MRTATWSFCLPTLIFAFHGRGAAAETDVRYRFQSYHEEDGRIDVEAQYFRFDHLADTGFSIGIQYAHDALAGATPIGTYDAANPNLWDYQQIDDERDAIVVEAGQDFGDWSLALELSHSKESDYISDGLAMKGMVELFEKNTVLTAGASVNGDKILSNGGTTIRNDREKDSFDLSFGLTQIFDRHTFVDVNLGYGESHGYLSDPYRRISETDTFTIAGISFVDTISHPENRPSHQSRGLARIGVTRYLEPLHAAVEGSYRFYATSDSLEAHTFELRWNQEIIDQVTLSPFFRYYRQTAAEFYHPSLTGTAIDGHGRNNGVGPHYSSDYRLAALDSLSYGVQLRYEPVEGLSFDLQYEIYDMHGRDPRAPSSFFPDATVVSAGASWHF
ncbi:DUF3570 domain-containing protein [Haloferula sargassicola]|uniref:DUF3570 domain-containing protein n=1 Tax=Haloferula sargassicola TaxID=490096 RepID=A0ABP9UT16_9BACT